MDSIFFKGSLLFTASLFGASVFGFVCELAISFKGRDLCETGWASDWGLYFVMASPRAATAKMSQTVGGNFMDES
jgi:hypothetical protein